jgi:hypothetical protein
VSVFDGLGRVRIGIVGTRHFGYDRNVGKMCVNALIDQLPSDWIVVSGGAPGPDTWAIDGARRRGLAYKEYLPEDGKYSYKQARLERNKLIAEDVDILVAYWDGTSRGTLDTFQRVIARRRPALMVREREDPWPKLEDLQRRLARSS